MGPARPRSPRPGTLPKRAIASLHDRRYVAGFLAAHSAADSDVFAEALGVGIGLQIKGRQCGSDNQPIMNCVATVLRAER